MSKVILFDNDVLDSIHPVIETLIKKGYICRIVHENHSNPAELVNSFKPQLVIVNASQAGFKVCKKIKSCYKTCFTNIVMVGATNNEHEQVEGFCVGAVDYIPLNTPPEEILATLEVRSSIESMFEKAQEYRETMSNIAYKNKNRTASRIIW